MTHPDRTDALMPCRFAKWQIWANPDDEIMMIVAVDFSEAGFRISYVTEHGEKGAFWDNDKEIIDNIRQIDTGNLQTQQQNIHDSISDEPLKAFRAYWNDRPWRLADECDKDIARYWFYKGIDYQETQPAAVEVEKALQWFIDRLDHRKFAHADIQTAKNRVLLSVRAHASQNQDQIELTDEWLGKIGFKWTQEERQTRKHWRLTLGWGAPNTRACMDDLSIEVASGSMDNAWFCWLQRGTRFSDNFLHVRAIKYQNELTEIITALTGTKFKLENCMYGNFYNDEMTAKMRPEFEAIQQARTKGNE